MRRRFVLPILGLVAAVSSGLASGPAPAEELEVPLEARRGLVLTVYQNDLALVHDRRWVALMPGGNRLAVAGISPQMIPASLQVTSETPGLRLTAQSYLPADLTPRQMLKQALGRKVRLVRSHPETGADISEEAVLLSLAEGPVLQVGERIEVAPPGRIVLDEVPRDLRPEPALVLDLDSRVSGGGELTLAYLTSGLVWQADYLATLDETGRRLALTGMVTLNNRSAITYEGAALRLVAGSVGRAPQPLARPQVAMQRMEATMAAEADVAMPAPQSVSDRYLYDTGLTVDLAEGERKQLTLFAAQEIDVERSYRFEGLGNLGGPEEFGPVQAALRLTFENGAGLRDGQPLPMGTLRVYETLADAPTLFAGEDRIDHTPVGGEVKLTLGQAFDITAKAHQTSFRKINNRSYESAREVVVKNAKSEPAMVEITGEMPRGWQVMESNSRYEQETANRLLWHLRVPPKGEAKLAYRVRVTY
jgi:hypothetical protein